MNKRYKLEYKRGISTSSYWFVYEATWFGWKYLTLFLEEQEARDYVARRKQPPKVIYID